MKKKTKIILISIFTIMSIAFGAVFILADSLIKTEEIKKIIINSIEKNLIGTKASIKDLSYSLGARVDFNIKDLKVLEQNSKKTILKTDEIKLKVSILAILMGGGSVDIKINSPYVNIYKKNEKLNWNTYLKKTQDTSLKVDKSSKKTKTVEVPSFIENSKINFRISNLKIDYVDKKLSSFTFNKILLKNLSLNKMTAYEIVSKVDYQLNENQRLKLNASLVGELSLKDLVSSNSFFAKSFLNITDISLTNYNIPNISSEVDFKLDENSMVSLGLNVKTSDLISSKLKILVKKEDISIDISSLSLNLSKVLRVANQKIENLDMNNSSLKLSGAILIDTKKSKLENKLNINLSNPLIYNFEGQNIKIGLNVDLVNQKLNLKSSIDAYQGRGDLEIISKINLMQPPSSVEKLAPININFTGENFNIPIALSPTENNSKALDSDVKQVKTGAKIPSFPLVKVYFDLKDSVIAGMKTKASSTIRIHRRNIKSKNTVIYIDDSKSRASFDTNLGKVIASNFRIKSENLNVKSFKGFLPLRMKELDMPMNLNAQGEVKLGENLSYNVLADLSSKYGSLKGLKLKEIVKGFLGKLGKYLPKKKDTNISEKYDSLYLKAKATEKLINVNSFNLVGKNKSLELNLNGKVSQVGKKSELIGDIYLRDYAAKLNKNFGTTKLPLRLRGEGFSLIPEFSYTSKRLVKKASKTKIKKLKNKLKEDLKKKAKDLFKGFKL